MTQKRLLFVIMHLTAIVFGDEVPFNVCLMQEHEIDILVACAKAHPEMPEKVVDHWNAQIAMFTGMNDAEVVLLVCKTSLDAGDALPEHEKLLDKIVGHCYEQATGQKPG